MSDACSHAAGLHWAAASLRVAALDSREASDAFLGGSRGAAIMVFLIGTGFHALAIAPAPLLIHEHDSVFGTLIDCVTRASGQAPGISAMIAKACQVEKPGFMRWQRFSCFKVLTFGALVRAGRMIFE